MSSSGLIYAMIVGAWAAYLVPMWLRRQDELNEARPTERFSTAIRLLTGRSAGRREAGPDDHGTAEDGAGEYDPDAADDGSAHPDAAPAAADHRGRPVDVRAAAVPATGAYDAPEGEAKPAAPADRSQPQPSLAERRARAKVLARRRRTTTLLFVALTAGAIAAATGGMGYLWAVLIPVLLLTAYIVRVRGQERRRYAYQADEARAQAAAQRVRQRAADRRDVRADAAERRAEREGGASGRSGRDGVASGRPGRSGAADRRAARDRRGARDRAAAPDHDAAPRTPGREAPPAPRSGSGGSASVEGARHRDAAPTRRSPASDRDERLSYGDHDERAPYGDHDGRAPYGAAPQGDTGAEAATADPSAQGRISDPSADRRALVEQTDHAEWVDQERSGGRAESSGWEPVPVPLPTYVTAPVAPRATDGVDLGAPDTWSSARSSAVEPQRRRAPEPEAAPEAAAPDEAKRRPRERGRTPLFDQYADSDRPRAANE